MIPVTVGGQAMRIEAPDDGYLVEAHHRLIPVMYTDIERAQPWPPQRPQVERQPELPDDPMPKLQGHYCCGCPGIRYNRDEYRRWANTLESYRQETGIEQAENHHFVYGPDGEPRPLRWPVCWVSGRCTECKQTLRTAGVE